MEYISNGIRSIFSLNTDTKLIDDKLMATLFKVNNLVDNITLSTQTDVAQQEICKHLGTVKEWCSYKELNGLLFWYDVRSITDVNANASHLARQDLFGPILVVARGNGGGYESFTATGTEILSLIQPTRETKRTKCTEDTAPEIVPPEVEKPRKNGRAKRGTFNSPRRKSVRLQKK